MRRFLKISAIAALVIFILLAAASVAVNIYFSSEGIKTLVVSKAEEATGRKVSVGDIDISIFSGIDLRDIYVGENQIYGDIPFIKVKRVTVGYSFSELFRKKVVLDSVTIERPEVYVRSRKGRLALSDLIKRPPPEVKPKKPLPFTVLLKSGTVKGIALFYEAEDARASLKGLDVLLDGDLYPFKGVNVSLSSKAPDSVLVSAKGVTLSSDLLADLFLRFKDTSAFSVQGELSLKALKAGVREKTLNPFDLSLKMDMTGDISGGADIKGFSLAVGQGNTFSVAGNIKELKGLKGLDMNFAGDSDLGEVTTIAEKFLPFPVTGTLKIGGLKVTGDLPDSLRFMTELSLKDVRGTYKGMQLPVSGFIKAEGDSKGHISMPEIKMRSGDALKLDAAVNASGWGKGRVEGKAKISIDNEKAVGLLPKKLLEKTGKIVISGVTEAYISVGRSSEKGPVRLKLSGGSTMKGLRVGPLSSNEQSIDFSGASDDLLKGRTSANAQIKAKVIKLQKGDMNATGESVDISVSASSPDMFKKQASVNAEIRAKGIDAKKGDVEIRQDALKNYIVASADIKAGDFSVKEFDVEAPDLFRASARGDVRGWGKELDLKANVDDIIFKNLLDKAPGSIRQKLPKMEIEGRGSLSASINGGLGGKEQAGNFINIAGSFSAKRLRVAIPDKGITIRDSKADIDFDLSNTVQWLSGRIKIGSVEKVGLIDEALGVNAGFELLADGPDLKIKNLTTKVPEKGLSFSLYGDIRDYGNAPRPDLDMVFSFNSFKKVDLIKGVKAQGATTLKAKVRSEKEKELALSGALNLDHMNVLFKDRAAVSDINGEINLSQKVSFSQGFELVTEDVREEAKGSLYDLMRPYVRKGYDLTLASASFDGYDAGPLSMDIYWKNGNLVIDRYDLALFEGGASGNIRASYRKGVPEYSVYSNIAGVKLDRVFKGKKGKELEINADLNLKGKGTEIEGDVNVTRIGKDILDRGLLSIDPKESNPQIVDIRKKVNSLGWVPKEVSVWVRHGELNMDITLQRKRFTLLNIVSLEKIPVRRVPVGYLIKKGLEKTD